VITSISLALTSLKYCERLVGRHEDVVFGLNDGGRGAALAVKIARRVGPRLLGPCRCIREVMIEELRAERMLDWFGF
jgi:hypothetical protein